MRKDKISKGTSLEKLCRQAIIPPIHFAAELEGYFTVITKEKGVAPWDAPPYPESFKMTVNDTLLVARASRDLTGRATKSPRISAAVGVSGSD